MMPSSSSSLATVRVEKATSDLLIGPDWTMNMDICDSINSNRWDAKDYVKAVKKRLQHKNPRIQLLALRYLIEQKLPKRMIRMQNGVEADDCDSDGQVVEENADSEEDCVGGERIYKKLGSLKTCPFEMRDMQVISLDNSM
ncbi:ENTH/VHS/GAT family protein [Actinidia rufa]|uniref:ENTH/VHS/GAT family protein n=1 Tax=Actinidia rufa TaxID=165716 RepID=A0A7J0DRH5_9ERIC|nr:ENTH/VHS/GAT family protein [Actinidia rufa]